MNIGILGSGDVGKALSIGFAGRGDSVVIASRQPSNPELLDWIADANTTIRSGTHSEAAEFSDFAIVATKWDGTEEAISLCGAANLAGKTVIDVTNPLVINSGGNSPPTLALGHTDSAGEQVQRWLPDAHVVKAFNIVNNKHMVHPPHKNGPPTMFYCGNSTEAKKTVRSVLEDFGWESVDIGGIEGSRLLEPLCILWVTYGYITGVWDHAFKLLVDIA